MTSSLVGSEMCIRDRASKQAGHRKERKQATARKGGGKQEQTRKQGNDTVSYTHLTLPTICSV
eukprot:2060400-Prorocentrum_lima.AAC.1